MKSQPICLECILDAARRTLKHINIDDDVKNSALFEVRRYLKHADLNLTPMEISFKTNEIITEVTKIKDPLKQAKNKANETAMGFEKKISKIIEESTNPFLIATKIAIAGNIIDFGISENYDLHAALNSVLNNRFAIDDTEKMKKSLKKAKTLLFLVDNAGEVIFDKILLRVISREFNLEEIYVGAKKNYFSNDVTAKDLVNLSFTKIPKVEIVPLENSSSVNYQDIIKPFIEKTDVRISKGQGNFELMSNQQLGIFFLFMVKCDVVSKLIKIQKGETVVLYQ
ncbi:MAG: damage-control phosphatase ARMT1 family protein [Candidatus Heimdallarchaeaceae archaeon]